MNLGYKTGVIFPKEDVKTYEVYEEDFQTQKVINTRNGEVIIGGVFTKQVDEENFLQLKKGRDLTVELAESGGLATHFCQYNPEPQVALPAEDAVDGDYTPRIVGAAQLRYNEIHLPLAPDNAAITAGDNLQVKDPKTGLDKTTATTNIAVAVESIGANTGGYILVRVEGPIKVKASSP